MSQDRTEENQDLRDFFISYTGRDRQWAEWIAWQLEEAGYTLFIQAWDFRPGSNFVAEMDRAVKSARRTLLVLSPAYLLSDYTFTEWAATFRHDPRGIYRNLVPVRIEPCEVEGLLGPVVYIDLVSLEEIQARERLLEGVQQGRMKPAQVTFPEPAIHHESPTSIAFPGLIPMIWNVPYLRNPHFTGRDELLDRLAQQLAPQVQEHGSITSRAALTQPQAIKGLGGIGKTQIAVEYAYRSRELGRYAHTFWINAASEEALFTSFTALAELLPTFPAKGETNQRKLVEAIKRWLEQCDECWLLIFDNADEVALVRDYLPQQGHGSILLTTRADAVGSLATSIEVEKMGLIEGTHLLLRRAQRFAQASDEEINQVGNLVVALDHFPLALDQAGAYIEETQCSFIDYLDLYRSHRQTLLARRGEQAMLYPDSVATTWLLSFQKIQQANPAAVELLHLCAFLAPDRIPEELLKDAAPCWPSLLQQAAANPFTFNQMLQDLLKFSLVKRLAADHMLSIHRLVQFVQRDRMEPDEQRQWGERVIRAVNMLFPEIATDIAIWPQCRRYLDQIQVCSTFIEQYKFQFIEAADLLDRAGRFLHLQGLYPVAVPLQSQALAIREQHLRMSYSTTAKSLNSLALLYKEQGKHKDAEPLFKRALALCEQELGANHPETAASLNNLALLYDTQGKHKDAEPLYQRALTIFEQELGANHPETLSCLNNLALLYVTRGKHREAEPLFKRALAIREQELGANHPDVANSLVSLAELYRTLGRYREAEPLHQRALAICEQELGASHPNTMFCLNCLAGLYQMQAKYEDAEPLYQRILETRERELGANHPDTATSLNNLALLYEEQKRYREAEPLHLRALAIREQELGANHPDTATSLNNLALLYEAQERYEEAEPLYQRALAIREKELGDHHPRTAVCLHNLAVLYRKQRKYGEAEPLYQRALAILEQELGSHHPRTAICLSSLAGLYRVQGRYEEAEPLYQRALAICEQGLGRAHPDTQTIRNGYVSLLRAVGREGDAKQLEMDS